MLNLELSVCAKCTKWVTAEARERLDRTKEAWDRYKKMNVFIDEWMKFKGYDNVDAIPKEDDAIKQQIIICK